MIYETLGEIKNKIEIEHDLKEETFISPEELRGYINDGISIIEALTVSKLGDYFMTFSDWITIEEFNEMPDDIYANKLRKVEVRRTNGEAIKIQHNKRLLSTDQLSATKYMIVNRKNEKPKLMIQDAENLNPIEIRYHYIRNANRLIEDSDICDCPEITMQHLHAFVRKRCYEKEKDPMAKVSESDVIAFTNLIDTTLSQMIDDDSDIMVLDTEFYDEYDCEGIY